MCAYVFAVSALAQNLMKLSHTSDCVYFIIRRLFIFVCFKCYMLSLLLWNVQYFYYFKCCTLTVKYLSEANMYIVQYWFPARISCGVHALLLRKSHTVYVYLYPYTLFGRSSSFVFFSSTFLSFCSFWLSDCLDLFTLCFLHFSILFVSRYIQHLDLLFTVCCVCVCACACICVCAYVQVFETLSPYIIIWMSFVH